jgi:1-deoxy-D-xylulose-5-phosphate reductoisomerase
VQQVLLLGSTGSIGENALRVMAHHPKRFRVCGLSARSRWERLVEQALQLEPDFVHVDEAYAGHVSQALSGTGIEVLAGRQALIDCPSRDEVDTLLLAVVGTAGLEPLLKAIRCGRRVCFANKEPLVTAGELLMAESRHHGVPLIPVDSEHSAILQCIQGEDSRDLARIILTASGGPFRTSTLEEFQAAELKDALKHPTWDMGAKITVDSATMMNKALEVIEAAHLYDLPEEQIDVLIHPQSIIHSMVQFKDGSVKAQLGIPDMRIPILYALAWPRHLDSDVPAPDWTKLGQLDFMEADTEKFRALDFAREALQRGSGYGCVMNAANEVAVEAFLGGKIRFAAIYQVVEHAMNAYSGGDTSLEDLIECDQKIRLEYNRLLEKGIFTTC